jgi:hypothetical protein
MHITRTKNDIWDIVKGNLNLDNFLLSKIKNLFYGNHLYVFLSPFDYLITLPIFNPASIIKADKTYNFLTIEIPCDFLPHSDARRMQFSTIPVKLSDLDIHFICGRITDQEDAVLDENPTLISPEKDLDLDSNLEFCMNINGQNMINKLVKGLVGYYKKNDQIKCMLTLFSKISRDVQVSDDNKRIVVSDFNFDESNDFKILLKFQDIFMSTKLEVRNECKTWIFNITNEKTISTMNYLREWLNIDYFKNFLMDIDVSVILDLDKKLIIITYERSTKYKAFIELARQVAKIFEIIIILDLQHNEKMMKYLKHYRK